MDEHKAIWSTLHRHLNAIYAGDVRAYEETTHPELTLYEWFVAPHRQEGLEFHRFMIEHRWATEGGSWRYDLLEPRLQIYHECAIASYTLLLSVVRQEGIEHRVINETRVLIHFPEGWRVVHVHKSPAGQAG